jgi:hypothetical protein
MYYGYLQTIGRIAQQYQGQPLALVLDLEGCGYTRLKAAYLRAWGTSKEKLLINLPFFFFFFSYISWSLGISMAVTTH